MIVMAMINDDATCGSTTTNTMMAKKSSSTKKNAKPKTSGIITALKEAETLYFQRDLKLLATIPVDPNSRRFLKRHCIRYVGEQKADQDLSLYISKLPTTFSVLCNNNDRFASWAYPASTFPPIIVPNSNDGNRQSQSAAFSYRRRLIIPEFISPTSSVCTIMDHACWENEYWIYLQSSLPVKTSTVCNYIYQTCSLEGGCFFTDEIPGGRVHTKRYEFTKLQHFKRGISELQRRRAASNEHAAAAVSVIRI